MSAHLRAAIAALRAEIARCMQGEDYDRGGFIADGGLAVLASRFEDHAPAIAALRAEIDGMDYERAAFMADGGLAVLATLVEDHAPAGVDSGQAA